MVGVVRDFLKAVGGGAKTSRDLTRDEARQAMALIANGECAPEQLGAFLMALRMKGESADELAGFVEALEARMARVSAPPGSLDVDAHGDGHEGRATLLPAAALAAAALGVPVLLRSECASPWAKHGLADACAALHLHPSPSAAEAARALGDNGVALLDLADYSPTLQRLTALRALFGRRTVAQTLCKLLDPLSAGARLVGVFHAPYLPSTARALAALGRAGVCVQALGGLPEAQPGKIIRALPASIDLRTLDQAIGPSPGAAPDSADAAAQQNSNALDGREPGLSRAAADCALMLHAARNEDPLAAFWRAHDALTTGAARRMAARLEK
jgi:anthranilate phosphoribosyltransferase